MAASFANIGLSHRETLLTVKAGRVWSKGVNQAKALLLRTAITGQPISLQLIDEILRDMDRLLSQIYADIARTRISRDVFGLAKRGEILPISQPNLRPLRALLAERQRIRGRNFKFWRFTLKKDSEQILKNRKGRAFQDFLDDIKIGRRGQDEIREAGLKALEKSMLLGSPSALGRHEVAKEIQATLINKVAGLNKKGVATFDLRLFPYRDPGKVARWNVKKYADLLADTAIGEATQQSFIIQAREQGTRLIKYNTTGEKYDRKTDPKCLAIDGNIFSIIPGGTTIKGRHFRYIGDILGNFLLAHPNDRHIARPFSEVLAARLVA